MRNSEGLTLEEAIQRSFDECLQTIQNSVANYGKKLAINTSKDVTIPPVTSTFKEETYEHSPSSDESSIGFGSPVLNFDDGDTKDELLFKPVPVQPLSHHVMQQATASPVPYATQKLFAPTLPSITQGPHTTTTTTTTDTTTNTRSSRDPRLVARNTKVNPTVKSVNTPYHTPSVVVKKPYARPPPTRSFTVPKIKFQGLIYNYLKDGIKISITDIITEGLLVEDFLNEFEKAIRQIGLDIEENWYGLMEGPFKELREKHMNLYLWFKKRLFEGLPWSGAKVIIQRQIGFHSVEITNLIKNALNSFIQQKKYETNQAYHTRFQLYATACRTLSLYPDHILNQQYLMSQNRKKVFF